LTVSISLPERVVRRERIGNEMVDFKKLRASKVRGSVIDPIQIFRRLPKPKGITDLHASQAEVLEAWFKRRDDRDLVIKLHTGGGKTLVGLLIAQAILNETHEPVIYLSPTVQLVNQTLSKAGEYGIVAQPYVKNEEFTDEFLTGKAVLVCAYQALFSGLSRFGAPGNRREPLKAGGIILDDAHVSLSTVRDSYTLEVRRKDNEEGFAFLTNLFRNDFHKIGKLGTFDDIVAGIDYGVLEVPYWSWKSQSGCIRDYLRKHEDEHPFTWPLLRDSLDYCHALIGKNCFAITPIFPMMDTIPTFSTCPRRVFMSATIPDDSAIVRTFDTDCDCISKPITSTSLAGISERMILAPELMKLDVADVHKMLLGIAKWGASEKNVGTVILVPSGPAAQPWTCVAQHADSGDKVDECVKQLQNGTSRGPFVFANRYDGIDLPDESCRLLVLDGLPRGQSEYDQYRGTVLAHGKAINTMLAQRIEQGMGRAARGPGDYCVVVLTGKDLVSWVSRSSNTSLLTSSSNAQLQIGVEVSKSVTGSKSLAEIINACLERNKEWIEYHAESLAESVAPDQIDVDSLKQAGIEQTAFRLWRDGYFEKAVRKLEKYCEDSNAIDDQSRGWLLQFTARIAYYWGDTSRAQGLQENAYASNRNLLRPQSVPAYARLPQPSKQASKIVDLVSRYAPRRGFLAEFDEVVSHLVPEASANQFEKALEDLGSMLGFSCERPDKTYDVGPDLLWLLNDEVALVIEAKSRKDAKNPFKKEQHGQLLVAVEWFKKQYPSYSYIALSVHPNETATKNAVADGTKALTYQKLNELISNARQLFVYICESAEGKERLVDLCTKWLDELSLSPNALVREFLLPFVLASA
jgi:replicative superfamily II helicase